MATPELNRIRELLERAKIEMQAKRYAFKRKTMQGNLAQQITNKVLGNQ